VPTGSFDYAPQGMVVADNAVPIGVFQYFSVSGEYQLLPNIRCEQIQYKEGADPPPARFSYILDELAANANGWPSQFEQVWPINLKPGYQSYVVTPTTQLAVLALLPDGTTRVLFHGFPRVPQTDVTPANQHVTFVAVGVAVRAWDMPIGVRIQRAGDDPQAVKGKDSDIATDLPVRFNPAGTGTRSVGGILPNCTPDGYDVEVAYSPQGGDPDNPYPVFLDSSIDRSPDPRTLWNLSKVVRYILATQNTGTDPNGDLWVANPDFGPLDALLQNRRPLDGSEFFDPSNPATYQTDSNIIRDFDATNKAWPEVIAQLLGFYGFGMRWVLDQLSGGEPYNYLEIYRKDADGPTAPKPVYLPADGTNLTNAVVNLSSFHAGFDFHGVANDVFVETHLIRWEISVVLAPGFTPTSGDGLAANRSQFLEANLASPNATAAQRKAYRYYIVDECADGFWSIADKAWVSDAFFDFSQIVPRNADGSARYAHRYRPGKGTLFSKDLLNKSYKAQLAVSTDYAGDDPPGFFEGNGTWQEIEGGWELLKDRLGIQVTADDPEQWKIGKPPGGNAPNGNPWPYPDGVLRGITGMSDPTSKVGEKQFWLRLTTVIEADHGIGAEATRRDASPLAQTIQRRVDASDHFHFDAVDTSSIYNTTQKTILARDDTDNATDHAFQLRTAHEFPPLTAALTIPSLTGYLQIGDRIGTINGRDVSLLVNAGAEQGEPPSYPYVVALTWNFQGEKQSTTIQLSDRRQEPRRPTA